MRMVCQDFTVEDLFDFEVTECLLFKKEGEICGLKTKECDYTNILVILTLSWTSYRADENCDSFIS